MYFLLSPAKNLNETDALPAAIAEAFVHDFTQPALVEKSCELVAELKKLAPTDIMALMSLSDKLAQLNAIRYQSWAWNHDLPFTLDIAKPAVFLFDGDVYTGLDAYHLDKQAITYLNEHLGILSGLYGLLKPLDFILPYRLEMGTKFATKQADNLYQFWGDRLTDLINQRMQANGDKLLVNLASNEYFKAVNPKKIKANIITPRFEDEKNGEYKVISFYAKKARGLMVKYAAQHQITDIEQLKDFDLEGYQFNLDASSEYEWVFRRSGF